MQTPLAVITGASSGIGAAAARLLAAEGWRVVLVARRRPQLEVVQQSIAAAGGTATIEPLDAADGAEVRAMAERVLAGAGAPDLIVNSAGAGVWRFIEETPPAEAVRMMGAPYLAAYNTTHAFMAAMLEHRAGLVIHVGSPASRIPWPGATAYTASRWALRGLHEALRQDLRGTGVSTCHVIFGEVSSAYFDHNPESRQYIPSLGRLIPVISPERCARVILGAVHRPRGTVIHPFMLRVFYWMAAVAPGPTRWMIGRTGRRH
jgi:NADP-dependent 3-hydroxy acid dehydrogenase YdfG